MELMVATASADLHVDVVGSGAKLVTQDNTVRVQLGRRSARAVQDPARC